MGESIISNLKDKKNIASFLLKSKSVYINFDDPFKLTSGRLSPVYVDCRRLISYPEIMREITTCFRQIVTDDIGLNKVDIIAGGATAGIPYASFLAKDMNIPLIYVRKEPKGHGRDAQIEGVIEDGDRVLLVEDLITDGGSKLRFKRGIEKAGGILNNVLCVFEYYSREANLDLARRTLKEEDVNLFSLIDWDLILEIGSKEGYLKHDEKKKIIDFLNKT